VILDEIVVHNFGVFLGRQCATLTPPSEAKPLVLFGGMNGNGKTTLLRAIELALYGPLARGSREGRGSYEDYLSRWINRRARPSDGAAVEVSFRTSVEGRSSTYRVVRSWCVRGARVKEKVDIYVDDVPDRVAAETWQEHVESLIPSRLSQLFFFDGERIETLADPESSSELLRAAIHALLGADLVDQLAADLQVLGRRKQKEARPPGPDRQNIESLEKELAQLEQSRANLQQERAALQNCQDRAVKDLDKLEARFRQEGGELAAGRQELERRKSEAEGRRQALHAQLIELAGGPLPLLLVRDMLLTILAQARREERSANAKVLMVALAERDAALLTLLKRNKASAPLIASVESFLSEDRQRYAVLTNEDCYLHLGQKGLVQCEVLLEEKLGKERDNAARALEEVEQIGSALDGIERTLARVPDEDALAGLAVELDQARKRLAQCKQEVAIADERLRGLENQKCTVAQKLEVVLRARREAELDSKDTLRFLRHSERVRQTLGRFKSALINRSLSRLEDLIFDGYRKLLRKSSLISSLRIDPASFALELWNGDHDVLPTERLSVGERQLLAVSMLWGLGRAAGRNLPVVVDTPLGRLDSAHRVHLVERYFPFASHQVVLLSTDEEIDQVFFAKLRPWLGKAYRLEYDEETASSTILPGYFW